MRDGHGLSRAATAEADLYRQLLRARAWASSADEVSDLGVLLMRTDGTGSEGDDAMKLLDKKTSGDLVRLMIFIVVTTLATGVLVILIGNLTFKGSQDYQAVFTDATGVNKGDDVRIAGVRVGTVNSVEIVDATKADGDDPGTPRARRSPSRVYDGTTLMSSTHATIRYRNLVGQRYISLSQEIGDAGALDPGATIPVAQTTPALDLTVLFNGFKPLFQALSPDDINKLSYEVIQVFQGEGGTLEGLLQSTASVTQTLADRDQVIGELIDNLDYVLDHIADRDDQLSSLIKSFRNLVRGLKNDRGAILDSLDGINDLSAEDGRPGPGHPPAVRRGHQAAAAPDDGDRPQQGRARPRPAGAAHQAREGRSHRHLRVLVQLLPVRLQGPGDPARRHRAGRRQHRRGQV